MWYWVQYCVGISDHHPKLRKSIRLMRRNEPAHMQTWGYWHAKESFRTGIFDSVLFSRKMTKEDISHLMLSIPEVRPMRWLPTQPITKQRRLSRRKWRSTVSLEVSSRENSRGPNAGIYYFIRDSIPYSTISTVLGPIRASELSITKRTSVNNTTMLPKQNELRNHSAKEL